MRGADVVLDVSKSIDEDCPVCLVDRITLQRFFFSFLPPVPLLLLGNFTLSGDCLFVFEFEQTIKRHSVADAGFRFIVMDAVFILRRVVRRHCLRLLAIRETRAEVES
jgi:hypothetical protein